MNVRDYKRALKLAPSHGGKQLSPCAVEVKNRGESKWRRYHIKDLNKIDWDRIDAGRIHFANKVWQNGIADEKYTTVVRIYER